MSDTKTAETWWEVNTYSAPRPIEIERSTEAFVIVNGRRRTRSGDGHAIVPTLAEAASVIEGYAKREYEEAERHRKRGDALMARANAAAATPAPRRTEGKRP